MYHHDTRLNKLMSILILLDSIEQNNFISNEMDLIKKDGVTNKEIAKAINELGNLINTWTARFGEINCSGD
jgi:hypothetical protein